MELPLPRSAKAIAGAYCVVGAFWVTVSSLLVHAFVDDPALVTWMQLVDGLVFIALSTVFLYGMVFHSRRELEATNRRLERANDRLDRALTQSSILQRLLRHNLRNSCNVIAGNAALLEERTDADATEPVRTIRRQTDRLVTLGEKTDSLRTILPEGAVDGRQLDLVGVVESAVERVRSRHPESEIRTSVPEQVLVETDPNLETALNELLENAVVHDDDPLVEVDVTDEGEWIAIEVRDSGPGIPEIERETLERGVETQTVHSDGLGLWIAHTVVTRAGGDLDIETEDSRGTVVTIRLPA